MKPETRLDHPTEIRRRVTAFLALLSSAHAHERLTTKMEPEQLAFELLRIWFDDVYLPSARYVDGLKGDYSATAADVFRSAFSDEECADLERFHRFVELRLEMVPEGDRGRRRIPIDDRWRALVRDAGYLLDDLTPEAGAIMTLLEDRLDSESSVPSDLFSGLTAGLAG